MYRKAPIRTYERKNRKELIISLERLEVSTIQNVRNRNRILFEEDSGTSATKEINDNSLYYDPFDTTFDRLVKNAKVQKRENKNLKTDVCNNNNSSYDSSKSIIADGIYSSHRAIKFTDMSIEHGVMEPVPKRKRLRKKPEMHIVKKTSNRKNKRKFNVKKNISLKKEELQKTKKKRKKKTALINSSMDTSRVREIKNDNNIQSTKEQNVSRNFKENSNTQSLSFFNGLKLKSCRVVLDGSDVLGWNNKTSNITTGSLKETQESVSKSSGTLKDNEIIKSSISNLKQDNVDIKQCFVEIEQLKITKKPFTVGKNCKNVISSTPIGKPIRSVGHLISLSPIKYSEELSGLNSITQSSSKDVDPSESKQVRIDSYEKPNLPKECSYNDKSVFSISNTNFSKSSLNKSKELDKESNNALATRNHLENSINDKEQSTEISLKELLVSMSSVSVSAANENGTSDVTSTSTQESTASDVKKKPCLNFSVDLDGSHSLFGDTNDHVCPSLSQVDAINTTDVSVPYVKKEELDMKMRVNYIELDKKLISNAEIELVHCKTVENQCEILDSVQSTNLSSDEQIELRNGEMNSMHNDIEMETETSISNNKALETNKELFSNSNIELMHCEIVENQCEILDSVKSTNFDASSSDGQIELRNGERNSMHNDIEMETETSISNNKALKTNKELFSNSNIELMHYEIVENQCEILDSVKSTNFDASSSDGQIELRNGERNCMHNDIEMEPETPISNNKALETNNCNMAVPYIVLNQLQDSIRITTKRKRYRTWELDLTSITEDCIASKQNLRYSKTGSKNRKLKVPRKTLQSLESIKETVVDDAVQEIEETEKPIYLKPGKFWARSLSILNNVQSKSNLEALSIGKGKNWRLSVQDLLRMQEQGIVQSCIKKKENVEEVHANDITVNKSEQALSINNKDRSDSVSLGCLTRRISVRVVPINTTVKSVEDVPFLEAYGIIPVKGRRVSLICNAFHSDSQKSSLYNIQKDDVDGHNVEEHVSTAKQVILERCFQTDYIPFFTHFPDLYLENCRKIGEGVYGEVFLYEHGSKKSVIKIIPIEGNELVNGEPQKKFHEILSEIVIAMELHNLRSNIKYNTDGFIEVKNIKCIRGKYPDKLVDLWNIYDEEKRSDNDCPSMFNDDQLYIALELGHGGQDLEAFVFYTADEAYALFIQAALVLAVAEKAVEFEHRDLHWGNILISRTNESHVYFQLGQQKIALISKGVKVSIIDFTLSRITYQGCSVFNDLASDPALFTAQGEYQFEIYRLMRDKIKNNWKKFEPYTNILWLHYTLDKMITAVRYKRKNLKIHKNGLIKLEELKNEILMYSSAFHFVTKCDKIVSLLGTDAEFELA